MPWRGRVSKQCERSRFTNIGRGEERGGGRGGGGGGPGQKTVDRSASETALQKPKTCDLGAQPEVHTEEGGGRGELKRLTFLGILRYILGAE